MRLRFIAVYCYLFLGAGSIAFAHIENPILQYTMKAIAADVNLVRAPTTKPTPGDVTDGMILTAIVRSRSSQGYFQYIIDKKDTEMLPGGIDELPDDQKKAMLQKYVEFLNKAKDNLASCEKQLQDQYAKASEMRDFAALKVTVTDLDQIMKDAHTIFRPGP